jgi:stearoyl-CoA desaturase (delta-9 desaturase)
LAGYLAIQRGPLFWVAAHRLHHRWSDVAGRDPHTPREGLWHVHFGWIQERRRDVWDRGVYHRLVPDLVGDRFYRLLDHEATDYAAFVLLNATAFAAGGWLGGGAVFDVRNGICFLVWVGLLCRIALLHAFGLINSVCHLLGSRPFATKPGDTSTNNALVALLIFGEGWHNNHHAFPRSARQGLRWYQLDPSWYAIRLLAALGLARDVREAPPRAQRRRARAGATPADGLRPAAETRG